MSDSAPVGVAEPVERVVEEKRADERTKPRRQPRYHVILWNDEDHSYEYVMLMLKQLFAHDLTAGYTLAQQVDHQGRAIVLTTTLEHAELKRDQIHAFGKDSLVASCQGSMSSSIEPEPS